MPEFEIVQWGVRPFQLVSLLDMLEFNLFTFVRHSDTLLALQREVEAHEGEVLTQEERLQGVAVVQQIEVFLAELGIDTGRCFERVKSKLHHPEAAKTKLSALILELRNRISDEISRHLFMHIPMKQAEYHDHAALFGQEIRNRFPKANKEITEAGNCYAAGNNTACVFHLMRAVELGVRPIVRQLRVNLPRPAELCEWGQLVGGMEDALKKLPKRTSTAASARSEFYSHALAQFRNFKDAWRNHVAHTRTSYNEHQAMSIMVNTRHFFEHIATRLKE